MQKNKRGLRETKRLLAKAAKAITSASWQTRTAVGCVESVPIIMPEAREFARDLRVTLEELYQAEKKANAMLDKLYKAT